MHWPELALSGDVLCQKTLRLSNANKSCSGICLEIKSVSAVSCREVEYLCDMRIYIRLEILSDSVTDILQGDEHNEEADYFHVIHPFAQSEFVSTHMKYAIGDKQDFDIVHKRVSYSQFSVIIDLYRACPDALGINDPLIPAKLHSLAEFERPPDREGIANRKYTSTILYIPNDIPTIRI